MKPMICAVITQNDLQAAKRAAPLADLFELRIDLTGSTAAAARPHSSLQDKTPEEYAKAVIGF